MALAGAKRVLRTMRPKVVLATFAPELIWRAALTAGASPEQARFSSARFLRFMERRGYKYMLGKGDVQELAFVRNDR